VSGLNGGGNDGYTAGQPVASGGNAGDRAALTTVVNNGLRGQQGSDDLSIELGGLSPGIYSVQYLWAVDGPTDRSFLLTAESGIQLGTVTRTFDNPRNYLIRETVAVSDGTLNLTLAQGPIPDDRRLISGLMVSFVDPEASVEPAITAFDYDRVTGAAELRLEGNSNASLVLVDSDDLDFNNSTPIAPISATTGSVSLGQRITLSSTGRATVQFNLDPSKPANFVRAETP
jgi:hypothetical protein